MKKILIVITTGFCSYGGLSAVAMNYYRNMDKEGLQIDFCSSEELENVLEVELNQYKSKYYKLPDRKKECFSYCKELNSVLKKGEYDVIHIHGNSATMVLELLVAKLRHIKKRIVHGHTVRSDYPFINSCLFPLFTKLYTDAIAVSKKTGEWLYKGREYTVLNNAIDLDKYTYNSKKRNDMRKKLGLNNYYVIGNVGKLNIPKNHKFLLDIFYELKRIMPNVKLLIVGGGLEYDNLIDIIKTLKLEKDVLLVGMKNNIDDYLNAMDMFVFTSQFEGLGMALIEAQATGLFCLSSDAVPEETDITGNVKYLSLKDTASLWANEIHTNSNYERKSSSEIRKKIQKNGYDIKNEANKLRTIYLN